MEKVRTFSIENVEEIRGIGQKTADTIHGLYEGKLNLLAKANPESLGVALSFKNTRALRELVTWAQEQLSLGNQQVDDGVVETKNEMKYIIRTVEIDNFTTLRKRVPILPSTCDECGFDVCTNRGEDFNLLSPEAKLIATQAMEAHKKLSHPNDPALKKIVSESELPAFGDTPAFRGSSGRSPF